MVEARLNLGFSHIEAKGARKAPADGRSRRAIKILGTRGIPARHGGFETFAEDLALFLVERAWDVTVYCQEDGEGRPWQETWRGARLVKIPVSRAGAAGTVIFDWVSVKLAADEPGVTLTLGYNTALFCSRYRLRRMKNLINMDGIEWRRSKYGLPQRGWLFVNEIAGAWLGDHLVADHPEIKRHLTRWTSANRITTIPYGSRPIRSIDPGQLTPLGLTPQGFALVIARPEPENSLLPIVRAFARTPRGIKLVVLGDYQPSRNPYHAAVKSAAGPETVFPGAIYDKETVAALRTFARLYVHGHTVGGTNPSLVEALAATSPVLAHDNPFNRWVAGEKARYFSDEDSCALALDELLTRPDSLSAMAEASRRRYEEAFTLDRCLEDYERLLLDAAQGRAPTNG